MMDVEKLAQLLKAATPGPWKVYHTTGGGRILGIGDYEGGGIADPRFGLWRDGKEKDSNAELIALAPDLAAEVIRLTAERDAAVAANQALVTENARLVAFVEEVRDCRPDTYSGRAHDPQDDVPDMIDASWLDAMQEDATALVGSKPKKAVAV